MQWQGDWRTARLPGACGEGFPGSGRRGCSVGSARRTRPGPATRPVGLASRGHGWVLSPSHLSYTEGAGPGDGRQTAPGPLSLPASTLLADLDFNRQVDDTGPGFGLTALAPRRQDLSEGFLHPLPCG